MDLSIKQEIVMLDGATICEGMSAMNHLMYGGHPQVQFNNLKYCVQLSMCCDTMEEIADTKKVVGRYLSSAWVEELTEHELEGREFYWLKYTYSKSSRC